MEILTTLRPFISKLPIISISNVVEILIITFLVFNILKWIQNTRAWILLKGLALIVTFTGLAYVFRFNTILWILSKIATIAVTALIIIFQPELRRALEQLGTKTEFLKLFSFNKETENEYSKELLDEIVTAAYDLSKTKTGALIVLEQGESLSEIAKTGISMGAKVTSQLLVNIFEHNTPLHDGAVVIIDGKIAAATCYLPLSSNIQISKTLGTRHRAALGVSENTDSVTVVVSEETGAVSVVQAGKLKRAKNAEDLSSMLTDMVISSKEEKDTSIRKLMLWRGQKNE